MIGQSPELVAGRTRDRMLFLVNASLGGACLGAIAAAIDWRRVLLNGDFTETVFLSRLWLTVTIAGAAAGLVLGALCLLALVLFSRRRGRPWPRAAGDFRLPLALMVALLLLYVGLRAATPFYEGRLPLLRIDQAAIGSPPAGLLTVSNDQADHPSVILLVLDTVRADHLSIHGYRHRTTPQLEQLAAESLVCNSARSTASWTLPAHGSLFTGLYPSQHRMHSYHPDNRSRGQPLLAAYPLAAHTLTLPSILRTAGWHTAAIYANPILSPRFRLDRGFDNYLCQKNYNHRLKLITEPVLQAAPWSDWLAVFRKSVPSARQVTRRVTHWLDHNARPPFFLFVNYMDAHWPYLPPPPYDTIFPGKGVGMPSKDGLRKAILGRQRKLSEAELAGLRSQYDGEIRYLDSQLGALFNHLRKRGIFDSSLIIVTSDHGEFFGEHQLVFHGRDLYEGGVKIPLLVKYPHGTPRGQLAGPVGLEDVLPTIMHVLGLPVPEPLSGVRLGAPRTGPTVSENYYSFKHDLKNTAYGSRFERIRRSMVLGHHKFIHSSDGKHELYDLHSDPDEARNLLPGTPELAEPFLVWAEHLERAASRPRTPEDLVAPRSNKPGQEQELRKQLAELGYLEEDAP